MLSEKYEDIRTTALLSFTHQSLAGQPPIIVMMLGETIEDSDKVSSWSVNSREKAARLCQNTDHISAWQSRDFDKKKYGGAVKTSTGEILSMSGLPEFGDEACCLVTLLLMDRMELEEAERIVEISGNDLFHELYDRCKML